MPQSKSFLNELCCSNRVNLNLNPPYVNNMTAQVSHSTLHIEVRLKSVDEAQYIRPDLVNLFVCGPRRSTY